MSKTLDLTGYSLEVVGRELRMKPNANGYGGAFLWALLMDVFLLIQWWSFGVSKDPRRVAFDKLSTEEQTGFLQAGAEAKHKVESIQKQLGELQMNRASGK